MKPSNQPGPDALDVPTLEELLSLVTEENRHPEIDSGPPVGREFRWWADEAKAQTPTIRSSELPE